MNDSLQIIAAFVGKAGHGQAQPRNLGHNLVKHGPHLEFEHGQTQSEKASAA